MSKLGILDFSSLHNTSNAPLLHLDANQGQPPNENIWAEEVAQQGEVIRQKIPENS